MERAAHDERDGAGASRDAGRHERPAAPATLEGLLDELRESWFEPGVDYAERMRAIRAHYPEADAGLNGQLQAVERAIEALALRARAVDEGLVEPPQVLPPRPPEAAARKLTPPPAPIAPIAPIAGAAAAPAAVAASDEPHEPEHHDTLLMEAMAIEVAITPQEDDGPTGAPRLRTDAADATDVLEALDADAAPAGEAEPALHEADLDHADLDHAELDEHDVGEAELLDADLADEPEPQAAEPEAASLSWSKDVELLYEDVLYLFQSGDTEGALVSLERLLVVAPVNEEIQEFIALNEHKLVDLYGRIMGPWHRIPRPSRTGPGMPKVYTSDTKVSRVLKLVDGRNSMAQIFDRVNMSRLEACCVLSQLQRARLVVTDPPDLLH